MPGQRPHLRPPEWKGPRTWPGSWFLDTGYHVLARLGLGDGAAPGGWPHDVPAQRARPIVPLGAIIFFPISLRRGASSP
eukprot:3965166-Amphidinium_carterae.1